MPSVKLTDNAGPKAAKKISTVTCVFLGTALLGGAMMALAPKTETNKAAQTAAQAPAAAAPKKHSREGDAASMLIMLKNSARNPDSFAVSEILLTHSGDICVEYRAQNGFGGLNVGHAMMVGSEIISPGSERYPPHWNQHCAIKGADITQNVLTIVRHLGL